MPAKTLPGYKREAGGARGYITPTGARISRRQYDKIAHAVAGVAKMSPQRYARQVRAQRQVNRNLEALARVKRAGAVPGEKVSKIDLRKSEEFKRASRDIKARGRSAEAEGRRKGALKTLGLRQGIPDWVPVGLSDRYRAGKLRRDHIPKAWRTE